MSADNPQLEIYLQPTPTMDYGAEIVRTFIRENSRESASPEERVISLYYAVRDLIRYDPYLASDRPGDFAASRTLELMRGWCVTKSLLYAACCRAIGLPARLGYADVRNHLSTENLRRLLGTDVFYWHGYTDVYLHGKWVKATPVFNIEMCERFRVKTLEFDGHKDSIFHPFDLDGQKHMEYLNFRGTYDDLPFEEISRDFAKYYPGLDVVDGQSDFDREVILETSA
jgi:transglutaminase-like putative cysteine protease